LPPCELLDRDKASLDIFWLRDESLEDVENLRRLPLWLLKSSRNWKPRLPTSLSSLKHSASLVRSLET
jgi:hypothetical protein